MTVNTFASVDAARKRIASKTHTEADEVLIVTWDAGALLLEENKRLLAQVAQQKAELDAAQASVRDLSHRLEVANSRGQPRVSLADMCQDAKTLLN